MKSLMKLFIYFFHEIVDYYILVYLINYNLGVLKIDFIYN